MAALGIILIDDDLDEAELFLEALKTIDEQISFRSYSDGKQAINQISTANQLPDYIFLDLNMPVLPGKEVLRILRKEKRFAQIPVVIYSTTIGKNDLEETRQLGATYFLTKPETFQLLCKRLMEIIHKP